MGIQSDDGLRRVNSGVLSEDTRLARKIVPSVEAKQKISTDFKRCDSTQPMYKTVPSGAFVIRVTLVLGRSAFQLQE